MSHTEEGAAALRPIVIVGLVGSLRHESYNRQLLRNAADLLPQGVEFELWDGLEEVPPYNEDDDIESAPPAAARLRQAIRHADGVLIATPEYNSSIPGQLKNAIDWASRPLQTNVLGDKPVAVIGASLGAFGAASAQKELRKVLATIGARVVEGEVSVGRAAERFDENGRLIDPDLRRQLSRQVAALVNQAASNQRLVA